MGTDYFEAYHFEEIREEAREFLLSRLIEVGQSIRLITKLSPEG